MEERTKAVRGNNPHQALALREREMDIVAAIDHVRDTASGPVALFSGIAKVLTEKFESDFCLLYLLSRETQALELKFINDVRQCWQQLGAERSLVLVKAAIRSEEIVVRKAKDVFPESLPEDMCADMQFVLIPIFMDEEPLGVLLMARAQRPFDADDIQVLATAESQIDSAVIQAYVYHELELRNKELETIYRVDNIRDQNLPFDDMLNAVLQELCRVIDAEIGFVMLYNPQGEQLEMRAVTQEDFSDVSPYYALVDELSREAVQRAEMICYREDGGPFCVVMCVPLILRNEIIGVLGVVEHKERQGFNADDQRLLKAIVSQMDTAIMETMEKRRLRRVLGRSVDPHVLQRVLEYPHVDILEGERMTLSVLYADLRGSTDLAERTEPELLVAFMNAYLEAMTDVLMAHEGTLDKFVGDEVMALFGAPFPRPDHALQAVRVGLAMQHAYQDLQEAWRRDRGIDATGMGVGIATGDLIVGEIGCEKRTDYTVIGKAANLGARICSVAKAGQVLISPATYQLVQEHVEVQPIPGQRFKGIANEMTVYHVIRVLE
jgi:class 3 adenylate cyclase